MCPDYWYVPKDKRGAEMHFCRAQQPVDTIAEHMLPTCKSDRCVNCHWYQLKYGRRPLEEVQQRNAEHKSSAGGAFGIIIVGVIVILLLLKLSGI